MDLKCTCSIKYSEHVHWYWQMCTNIAHIECWALDIESYVQIYQYMKWYILYPRNKYQKNWGNSNTNPLVPELIQNRLAIKAPIPFEWTYHTNYRSVHILQGSIEMFHTWHQLWPTFGILTRTLHVNCSLGFKGLTTVAVQQNYFEVNNEYWSWVEGPGMASPISILSPKFSCKISKEDIAWQWQTIQKVLI